MGYKQRSDFLEEEGFMNPVQRDEKTSFNLIVSVVAQVWGGGVCLGGGGGGRFSYCPVNEHKLN